MSVITVENLSKRYLIGHQVKHDTLRDSLTHGIKSIWRNIRTGQLQQEEFWALQDINFTVEQGEVLGIIGRNGAGKSTLLKILSRITEPTSGSIKLQGRVASLLEVGTGFHPELSGRENIFLNGAILGMTRAEIARKFDEIVDFAEVERFLDTPVKRYSSGMYVRLAFAVAAHLEPEVLIVDEVLAVGDVAFQQKCMGKIQSVSSGEGRTVLFVSHNMAAIRKLCSQALYLQNGHVVDQGETPAVIARYLSPDASERTHRVPTPSPEQADRVFVQDVNLEDPEGAPLTDPPFARPWRIRVVVRAVTPVTGLVVGVGLTATGAESVQTAWHAPTDITPGDHEFIFHNDHIVYAINNYTLVIGLSARGKSIQQFRHCQFDIIPRDTEEFFETTSNVGHILNSLRTTHRTLTTPDT